jgi:lambda repressor-like predicted transcriptional regulator
MNTMHPNDLHSNYNRICHSITALAARRLGITPNDLHSNYDRICHSITALAARRLGIQESEIKFMTSTLRDMKHTIRTAFGDSTDSHGGAAWTM